METKRETIRETKYFGEAEVAEKAGIEIAYLLYDHNQVVCVFSDYRSVRDAQLTMSEASYKYMDGEKNSNFHIKMTPLSYVSKAEFEKTEIEKLREELFSNLIYSLNAKS